MEKSCGASVEQFAALNQNMFNAPAVIYVCIDKALSEWSLYDIGAYSQTFMLAALEQGLSTIPAITLTLYSDAFIVRRELKILNNLKITIGIAVGYADRENGINKTGSTNSSVPEARSKRPSVFLSEGSDMARKKMTPEEREKMMTSLEMPSDGNIPDRIIKVIQYANLSYRGLLEKWLHQEAASIEAGKRAEEEISKRVKERIELLQKQVFRLEGKAVREEEPSKTQ
jgi:hypothetical protein